MGEADADLVGERRVDDLEISAEPVQNTARRCDVEVSEWRMHHVAQCPLEQDPRRLERSVKRGQNSEDSDGQVDEADESIDEDVWVDVVAGGREAW